MHVHGYKNHTLVRCVRPMAYHGFCLQRGTGALRTWHSQPCDLLYFCISWQQSRLTPSPKSRAPACLGKDGKLWSGHERNRPFVGACCTILPRACCLCNQRQPKLHCTPQHGPLSILPNNNINATAFSAAWGPPARQQPETGEEAKTHKHSISLFHLQQRCSARRVIPAGWFRHTHAICLQGTHMIDPQASMGGPDQLCMQPT